MASEKAIEALRQYAKGMSQQKQQAVHAAIDTLIGSGIPITVSAVARTGKVSREFVHSHAPLLAAVRAAARRQREASDGTQGERTDKCVVDAGMHAERSTLISTVKRQKATIAEHQRRIADLEKRHQRWLGSQLESSEVVDPEVHADLRITTERLMADKRALTARVEELRRLVATREADLAASRQAHMEDVASFAASDPEIRVLRQAAVRGL